MTRQEREATVAWYAMYIASQELGVALRESADDETVNRLAGTYYRCRAAYQSLPPCTPMHKAASSLNVVGVACLADVVERGWIAWQGLVGARRMYMGANTREARDALRDAHMRVDCVVRAMQRLKYKSRGLQDE